MNPRNYKVRTVGKFEGLEECLGDIGSSVEGASSDVSSSLKEVVDAIGKTNDLIGSMKTDCCKVICDKLDTIIEYLTPKYTFTIVPTPDDATVVINGETTSSVTVTEGTEMSWEVSKDGYETQSGTLTLTEDTTLNVDLPVIEPEPFTFVYESNSMKIVQGTIGSYRDMPAVFAIDGAYDIEINGTMIEDIEETMSFDSYLNSSGNTVKIYPHEGTTVNHAYDQSEQYICQTVYISEVNSWGDAVFGDVSHMFTGCQLEERSDVYPIIKSVPPLSMGFSKCEDFTHFFFMCTSLTSIPENFFPNCPSETTFEYCFGYSGLTSIPENLFSNCPSITDVSYCFGDCSGLTSIPENLFANCPSITDVRSCFYGCRNLTSIPENLFSNCTKITDFRNCFSNNSSSIHNLTGESAYDIVDINGQSVKIHLYERVNYPDIYTAPTSYRYCYSYQTNLDDYDAANAAGWA